MLLTARNVSKTYGPRLLFSGITLGLSEGERVGLIGANGSGKSTMLKIFAGLEQADDGRLESKRGLVAGYVAQEDSFPPNATCLEILSAAYLTALHDEHEADMKAERMLYRAGFDDPTKLASALSGGWRKRLAIMTQVARQPEILLMDEPTNHLDLEGIEWLEDIIAGASFGSLIVSHDRRFLEETVTRIIDLSRSYPEGYLSIEGTYTDFVIKREEFLAAQLGRQQAVASAVRKEIAWLQRGAKARTTKAKGRIERAGDMIAELADLKTRNAIQGAAEVQFSSSERQTRKMIELKSVTKAMGGRTLFSGLNLVLGPGMKLGLLGPNGSGKSTLIRVICGGLAPDGGTVFRADGLKVVLFDQHRKQLDERQTLRRALSPAGDTLQFQGQQMHVSGWAKKFLFRAEQLDMPISELSGGERARVLIAQLMLSPADVLVLDEPTNDLDIATLDVLEESLEEFPGVVVMVTHDRYLLDRVSSMILALDGEGGAKMFAELGQWERHRVDEAKRKSDDQKRKVEETRKKTTTSAVAVKSRLSWKDQKELESMEAAIAVAEADHARLAALADDATTLSDHVKSREIFEKIGLAQARVEALYARWAELEAKK